MKKKLTLLAFCAVLLGSTLISSCGDEDCNGCPDDAPYGAAGGSCYATLSECEDNESGTCELCQ